MARRAIVALALVLAIVVGGRLARATTLVPLGGPSRIAVRYEPGLEREAERVRAAAEAQLDDIAADLTDLPRPRAIEIQLVRDARDLASVAPAGRGAPPWAIGVAYPDLGVISIALRRGAEQEDPEVTLHHELAHLALGAAIGNRAPHWLHEGFAYQRSREWAWQRTETLAGMAWFGGIVPLDDLDASFPAEELPAHRAYAEAYDFVGYLARRGRYEDPDDDGDRWPYRRFLAELGHGADIDTAAIRAYGRPIHALFDEWRDSLSKRYLFAPVELLGVALWVACALLVTIAFVRRRRANRRRIAQWEREERAQDEAIAAAAAAAAVPATAAGIPPPAAWN